MDSANNMEDGGRIGSGTDRELRTLAAKIVGQLPEDPERARRVLNYTLMFLNDFIDEASEEDGPQSSLVSPLKLVRRNEGSKSP